MTSNPNNFELTLREGGKIRVHVCADGILHVRANRSCKFDESLLERYGIVNTNWPSIQIEKRLAADTTEWLTSKMNVSWDSGENLLTVSDAAGKYIIKQIRLSPFGKTLASEHSALAGHLREQFKSRRPVSGIIGDSSDAGDSQNHESRLNRLSIAEFAIKDGTCFYGGGSASRSHMQHRNRSLHFWATYQKSEAPVPFIISSDGWGIFNSTTVSNYFDIGHFKEGSLFIANESDELDFYIFVGQDLADVLMAYTALTGRPYLLPKWSYGLAFGSNIMENQFNVIDNALRFRQERIPCDIYWLEPQWMEKNYDLSTGKKWNESRFQVDYSWLPNPDDPKKSNLFLQRMKDLGFKVALWLNADQDLSIEEEDRLAAGSGKPQSGKEHWFPHLHKFIDQGIAGFKLDPSRTIGEHPERQYHNGRTDSEMHNLNQILLLKQMYETFKNHTGRRSFHHYCGGYAGSQHWGALTVGDNGGGPKTLFDILNLAFCGVSNVAVDALEDLKEKREGIHYMFLTPWIQLNSWAWLLHPWYYNEKDKDMFRFYAQLRYSLIPYIYSAAIEASLHGIPIVRPMPLAYPEDPELRECVNQYMLGDCFLVGAFTDTIRLPEGSWTDYWTGKRYEGNQLLKCNIPDNRGGPLFVKSGSVIPMAEPQQFIDNSPLKKLILKVFPGGKSEYVLNEDDGITFEYEKGAIAKTLIHCDDDGKSIEIKISPPLGSYSGMPDERIFDIRISLHDRPVQVEVNGAKTSSWRFSEEKEFSLEIPISRTCTTDSVIHL